VEKFSTFFKRRIIMEAFKMFDCGVRPAPTAENVIALQSTATMCSSATTPSSAGCAFFYDSTITELGTDIIKLATRLR